MTLEPIRSGVDVGLRQVGEYLERRGAEPLDARPAPRIEVGEGCRDRAVRRAQGDFACARLDKLAHLGCRSDASVPVVLAADRVEVTAQRHVGRDAGIAVDQHGRAVVAVVVDGVVVDGVVLSHRVSWLP